MKEPKFSRGEIDLLTEPYDGFDGHWTADYWLCDSDPDERWSELIPMWDKILSNTEVSQDLVEKIRQLLPQGPNPTKSGLFASYTCYTLAIHLTGRSLEELDTLSEGSYVVRIPPKPHFGSLTRDILLTEGYQRIETPSDGEQNLIILTAERDKEDIEWIKQAFPDRNPTDLEWPICHAAFHLGSSDKGDYVFHKPGEFAPEIRRLQTVVNGYACEGEMSPARTIRAEFWKL